MDESVAQRKKTGHGKSGVCIQANTASLYHMKEMPVAEIACRQLRPALLRWSPTMQMARSGISPHRSRRAGRSCSKEKQQALCGLMKAGQGIVFYERSGSLFMFGRAVQLMDGNFQHAGGFHARDAHGQAIVVDE